MVAFCYLPALMVVLRKPNEGDLPACVGWFKERKAAPFLRRLPAVKCVLVFRRAPSG
jgi:hypothetical protein